MKVLALVGICVALLAGCSKKEDPKVGSTKGGETTVSSTKSPDAKKDETASSSAPDTAKTAPAEQSVAEDDGKDYGNGTFAMEFTGGRNIPITDWTVKRVFASNTVSGFKRTQRQITITLTNANLTQETLKEANKNLKEGEWKVDMWLYRTKDKAGKGTYKPHSKMDDMRVDLFLNWGPGLNFLPLGSGNRAGKVEVTEFDGKTIKGTFELTNDRKSFKGNFEAPFGPAATE